MKYLHTMVRVTDIEQSLRFYRDALGLRELSRKDYPQGRYTLVFLAAPGDDSAQVELTHNWDPENYAGGSWSHDQPAAPRRPHGLRALAGRYIDRAAAEGRGAVSGRTLDRYA